MRQVAGRRCRSGAAPYCGFVFPWRAGARDIRAGARGQAVPDLKDLSAADLEQPPTYVPNRNMILLSVAAAFAESCGAFDVFYGAQALDEYGMGIARRIFIPVTSTARLALNRRKPVTIHAPFIEARKSIRFASAPRWA